MKVQSISSILIVLIAMGCGAVQDIFDPTEAPVIHSLMLSENRVLPRDTILAVVDAENPEKGILQYSWYSADGRFVQPADRDSVRWIAPFDGGTYTIKVTVSNSDKNTAAEKKVYVSSLAEPFVNIKSPGEDHIFILYEAIQVTASAYHDNGIEWVRLLAISPDNDSTAIDTLTSSVDDTYTFIFTSFPELVGKTTLLIEAKADTDADLRGTDTLPIKIEGILPGEIEQ